MVMTSLFQMTDNLLYPDSDGKPMAENTEQYRWIVIIKENLEILFANDVDVFIAADLLWYPIQVEAAPAPREAPDVMIIFGRPKGRRGSYQQWRENNIPAQVAFEILSPSNKTRRGEDEMDEKFEFYQQYGVEEYYIYDPDTFSLSGWLRQGQSLNRIPTMSGWVSPRLGIQFEWQRGQELILHYPDGQRFLSSVELAEQVKVTEQQLTHAEQRLTHAEQQLIQEQQKRQQLAEQLSRLSSEQLQGLGIDPTLLT
jgi:Uma2 family endonuclease